MSHKHIDLDKEKLPEKIKQLQEELARTKYNKRTQFHIGLVKAKIARLKEELEKKEKAKKKGKGYVIKKQGDATIALIGFPSVGKSTLLNALTNAKSETANYDFTTTQLMPGIMFYKGAKIQIFDLPGIIEDASKGKGKGKEILSCLRSADLLLIILDPKNLQQYEIIKKELYNANIRINTKKPDVKIIKTNKGGINLIARTKLTYLNKELVKKILNEFKIINADVIINENITIDQFIDSIQENKVYLPAITLINKADLLSKEEKEKISKKIKNALLISALKKQNIDKLKELIFKKLELIRIFMKEIGKKPDLENPLIMKKGATIKDVCEKLHKDFVEKFKFARVWGSSVKFDGQKLLNINRTLNDKDILEIHLE